jgi:hypothetical protein
VIGGGSTARVVRAGGLGSDVRTVRWAGRCGSEAGRGATAAARPGCAVLDCGAATGGGDGGAGGGWVDAAGAGGAGGVAAGATGSGWPGGVGIAGGTATTDGPGVGDAASGRGGEGCTSSVAAGAVTRRGAGGGGGGVARGGVRAGATRAVRGCELAGGFSFTEPGADAAAVVAAPPLRCAPRGGRKVSRPRSSGATAGAGRFGISRSGTVGDGPSSSRTDMSTVTAPPPRSPTMIVSWASGSDQGSPAATRADATHPARAARPMAFRRWRNRSAMTNPRAAARPSLSGARGRRALVGRST